MTGAPLHILLVEDSRADVKILQRALREGQIAHRLTVVSDGRQALDYLDKLDRPDAPDPLRPDLVLLDLNLPDVDGVEVLARVKARPRLRGLPVVVLTTSGRAEDVERTYQAGANTFIPKPAEYPHYRELVRTLYAYWNDFALRPGQPRPTQERRTS